MLTVSQLFIYPVKSLGGISLQQAVITDRGFEHDRRWMLVDEQGTFISQRSRYQMALFRLSAVENGFRVTYEPDGSSMLIAYHHTTGPEIRVTVWDDNCTAVLVNAEADAWFSARLNLQCRLVYMTSGSLRPVDERYARRQEIVSFADAYPYLLLGQSSLSKLNAKLTEPVMADRFRANIIFTGAEPHFEDQMAELVISGVRFFGVKPCARCVMIGVDQQTAQLQKEPTKTLAGYRTKNKKIYFGQNLIHQGEGILKVGDQIQVIKIKPDFMLEAQQQAQPAC